VLPEHINPNQSAARTSAPTFAFNLGQDSDVAMEDNVAMEDTIEQNQGVHLHKHFVVAMTFMDR
jgi:hypothetical protein